MTARDRWIDLETLMAIQDLQWRAKTVAQGVNTGLHRSTAHGFSVEFNEYRPFTDGDDPRTIDWKLYARSDRYFIKKFEDETNRRCYLVLDQSRSMGFGSTGYTKLEYARTLVATLALHLLGQRDAVGLMTLDEKLAEVLVARYRLGQWRRILTLLERESSGRSTDVASPLADLAQWITHRSLIVIVSDFLVDVDELRVPLSFLRARQHEIVLLRVLDPQEIDFNPPAPVMVQDLESGQEMFVDPLRARRVYQERFQKHADALQELSDSLAATLESWSTREPLDAALYRFLSLRSRRTTGGAHALGARGRGGRP